MEDEDEDDCPETLKLRNEPNLNPPARPVLSEPQSNKNPSESDQILPNPTKSENRSWNDGIGKMPLFSTGCESDTGDNLCHPVAGAARTCRDRREHGKRSDAPYHVGLAPGLFEGNANFGVRAKSNQIKPKKGFRVRENGGIGPNQGKSR